MVWCRSGVRGENLSVYNDFFLRATNTRKPLNPHALYHLLVFRAFLLSRAFVKFFIRETNQAS